MIFDYLEALALVVGLTTALGGSVRWVWLLSVNVRETRQMVKRNKATLETLENEIINKLDAMRLEAKDAGIRYDDRLDKIESSLSFLYGLSKRTIRPKD